MVERLAEDHANARRLAEGLAVLPGVVVDAARVQTDIVIFELHRDDLTPEAFVTRLGERGVRLFAVGGSRLRMVTNYHVRTADIDAVLKVCREVLAA
jgi:threonine aldolase